MNRKLTKIALIVCSHILFAVLVSSYFLLTSYQVKSQDKRVEKFESLVEALVDSLNFNGVLSATDQQGAIYNKAIGSASFEHKVELKVESKFRIASVSKMILSYMVYILVDQGKLQFDDPATKHIPLLNNQFKNITVRNLLDHTSGLMRDIDLFSQKSRRDYFSRDEIVQLVNSSSLQSVPGHSFSYSNVGYSLIGLIIERVTGQTLNQSFQQLLAIPIKLTATGHEEGGNVIEELVAGYDLLFDCVFNASFEDKSHVFGAGSFYSNAVDLTFFGQEIINGSLLSDSMHTLYLKEVGNNRTGGGWITYPYRSELANGPQKGKFLTFAGSCPGYNSFVGIFLDHKIVVVSLSNLAPINTSLVRNTFGNIAVGLEKESVSKPTYLHLLPMICQGQLKRAVQLYDSLLVSDQNNSIQPSELNQMGYVFLSHQRLLEAIHIFRFASMLFPNNSNVWDSLGEVLLLNGDITNGLEMYKKSLQLNPKNEGARKIIDKYQ